MKPPLTYGTLEVRLSALVTHYDRVREKRRDYNRYALGQYLLRVDEVVSNVDKGARTGDALAAAFNDRLLDYLTDGLGLPRA